MIDNLHLRQRLLRHTGQRKLGEAFGSNSYRLKFRNDETMQTKKQIVIEVHSTESNSTCKGRQIQIKNDTASIVESVVGSSTGSTIAVGSSFG